MDKNLYYSFSLKINLERLGAKTISKIPSKKIRLSLNFSHFKAVEKNIVYPKNESKRRGYFAIWNQNYKQLFCQIHLPIQFAWLWLQKQSRKPKISSCWKKNDRVNKTESLISDFKTIPAVWLSKKNWKSLSGLS